MFGGWEICLDGLMFALVADDALYLKADDVNCPDFEARGAGPFKPWDDKPTTMSCYEAPAEVMKDDDALGEWMRNAHAASVRAATRKGGKRPLVR